MKREVPLFITAVIGLFMILSFFVPHQVVSVPADFLQQSVIIVLAFSYILGGANLLKVNFDVIYKRQSGWLFVSSICAAFRGLMINSEPR